MLLGIVVVVRLSGERLVISKRSYWSLYTVERHCNVVARRLCREDLEIEPWKWARLVPCRLTRLTTLMFWNSGCSCCRFTFWVIQLSNIHAHPDLSLLDYTRVHCMALLHHCRPASARPGHWLTFSPHQPLRISNWSVTLLLVLVIPLLLLSPPTMREIDLSDRQDREYTHYYTLIRPCAEWMSKCFIFDHIWLSIVEHVYSLGRSLLQLGNNEAKKKKGGVPEGQ